MRWSRDSLRRPLGDALPGLLAGRGVRRFPFVLLFEVFTYTYLHAKWRNGKGREGKKMSNRLKYKVRDIREERQGGGRRVST